MVQPSQGSGGLPLAREAATVVVGSGGAIARGRIGARGALADPQRGWSAVVVGDGVRWWFGYQSVTNDEAFARNRA